MNVNHLIHILKTGYSYEATDSEGNTQLVLNPPNRYMLAAAKVIETLSQQLHNNQEYMTRVTHERDEYMQQTEYYRQQVQSNQDMSTTSNPS